jgi:hypothetical protein
LERARPTVEIETPVSSATSFAVIIGQNPNSPVVMHQSS